RPPPACWEHLSSPSIADEPVGPTSYPWGMLNRTDLRSQVPTAAELRATLPRAEYDVDAALHHVRPVVEAVRDRGVEAVLEYTERFDKVRPATVRVPVAELAKALDELDPAVRAALLGVEEVWAVGGAQAVALLAYGGTDTDGGELAPVDIVTGPGNIYLTAAKRLLRGLIGIDSEAGPTEIAILADETADPVHVAADLISQAEHDPLAASVLVTTSEGLADAVEKELAERVAATKHNERVAEAL